jgi:hypothetical protein
MKPSKQYSFEILKIRSDIEMLKNRKIYELQKATHYPAAYTLGARLEEELDELLYALDNQLPRKAQELRDAKNRAEQNLLNEKE